MDSLKLGNGSPGRTRTADQMINSHLLYRLSYRGSGNIEGAYGTDGIPAGQ